MRPTKCGYCGSREVYQDEMVPRSMDYGGEPVAHYWTCADCGWASEPVVQEPPELCPMGCGRTTEAWSAAHFPGADPAASSDVWRSVIEPDEPVLTNKQRDAIHAVGNRITEINDNATEAA